MLPPLCPLAVSSYDFSQTSEIVHRAEAMTRLWLKQNGLRSQGSAPDELMPHNPRARDPLIRPNPSDLAARAHRGYPVHLSQGARRIGAVPGCGDNMNHDRLRQLVASLHQELGDAKSVDAESRGLMGALMKDIDRVLETYPAPRQDSRVRIGSKSSCCVSKAGIPRSPRPCMNSSTRSRRPGSDVR